eukprot:CAMPEP_0117779818 /NCGR_PEP_ID=MMETSP0948-20121206/1847_1 /TAXON_ID=44440 /ORGANISM="Chattonella subsalsa, Strain CCMP2191" /LENGTH=41 /DNA_ID= /DNA_START= /DNA_END= /DNA_ORIENTATION=
MPWVKVVVLTTVLCRGRLCMGESGSSYHSPVSGKAVHTEEL